MDIRKVKKLIALLEESGIAEIEISEGEESVRISRYPQEAEAAVYFCCLEALQNIAKYANASRATIPENS